MGNFKNWIQNEKVQKALTAICSAIITLLVLWFSTSCCTVRSWHFDTNTKIESETNYSQEK